MRDDQPGRSGKAQGAGSGATPAQSPFDDEMLRAALATYAREELAETDDLLWPERLMAYAQGELGAEQREGFLERLALDPEAARTVADLQSLLDLKPRDPRRRVGQREVAAAWDQLRARLPGNPEPLSPGSLASGQPVRSMPAARQPPADRHRWWPNALAAALMLATLGLGIWNVWLAREVSRLRQPQLNIQVASLAPEEAQGPSRAESTQRLVRRSPGAQLLLLLNTSDLETYPHYRVRLLDATSQRLIWSDDGLQRLPQGNFSVQLPRSLLPAGSYRIELLGGPAGPRSEWHALASYRLDVDDPGPT